MTRWARGRSANKKKPLPASDWMEMASGTIAKDDKRVHQPTSAVVAQTNSTLTVDGKKKKTKNKKKKQIINSNLEKIETKPNVASTVILGPPPTATKKTGVVDIITELERSAGVSNRVELAEYVRKDARREARRVKRLEARQNNRVCFNCRQRGHDLAACPDLARDLEQGTGVCFKCGSTEHSIAECRAKVADGKLPFAKCFICGETGHISRRCSDNPRGLYPNGGACLHCGSVEHYKRDCPSFLQTQGVGEIRLTTLDNCSSLDEEPTLKRRPESDTRIAKKPRIVKF